MFQNREKEKGGGGGEKEAEKMALFEVEWLTEAKMHCLRLEAGFPFVVGTFRSLCGRPWNPARKTLKSRSRGTASQAYHHALFALAGLYPKLEL